MCYIFVLNTLQEQGVYRNDAFTLGLGPTFYDVPEDVPLVEFMYLVFARMSCELP